MKSTLHDTPDNHFAHWYALSGVLLGCLVFAVGTGACVYRCYRQRRASGAPSVGGTAKRRGLTTRDVGVQKSGGLPGGVSARSLCSFSGDAKTTERGLLRQTTDVERGKCGGAGVDVVRCAAGKPAGENEAREKPADASSPTSDGDKMTSSHHGLGRLEFSARYDQPKSALVVTILRAVELPPKLAAGATCDPYVKLQLLPEKRQTVKTRVVRKTLRPTYDETFTFYGIDVNQLHETTLHFVVLSFDRFSRDDVIGEVVYPLDGAQVGPEEVTLWREIAPRHMKIDSQGRGELLVSLCYQPAANRLSLVVLKARNLPKMDITGLSDPYVRVYMLYNGQRVAKKKTHVKRRSLNPVFNESFLFDVPSGGSLQNISLEFLLLDWDRMTKNEIIGKVEIGARPTLTNGASLHWRHVMASPRKQIAEWHRLTD